MLRIVPLNQALVTFSVPKEACEPRRNGSRSECPLSMQPLSLNARDVERESLRTLFHFLFIGSEAGTIHHNEMIDGHSFNCDSVNLWTDC
jgi:hypothetical protein